MDVSSQLSLDVLDKFKASLSEDDLPEEVITFLPSLISYFEENEDRIPELVSLLLGPTIQALPVDEIDQAILQPFLPLIKQYIVKMFAAIHELMEQHTPSQQPPTVEISNNLELCIQTLVPVEELLLYLLTLGDLSVSTVFHLPKVCTELVHEVFLHCQKSQKVYGEWFLPLRNELMCLFQKSHKIQVGLLKLLNEKLSFDCSYQNELQLLIDVLDVLSLMSHIVADLDTMSLVSHWKGYAQLVQTYAADLRPRLNISTSINYLATNISQQLPGLMHTANADKKIFLKTLKVSSLHLKVMMKLCEHYKGYLGDCHVELLSCIINLAAYTAQYLKQSEVPKDLVDQITTNLTAGAAPLLTSLLQDPIFFKEYFLYVEKVNTKPLIDQIGYCNLTCLILKKLIQVNPKDEEVKQLWLGPNWPLLKIVLHLLCSCDLLFSADVDDVYQSLVVNTAGFLVTMCSADMYPSLEDLLIKQLLQPKLWPAIFSSDMLCLIARFGSSELCLQLVTLLTELLKSWPAWDYHRPEWIHVSWTQGRLLQLLSTNQLQTFPACLPPLNDVATDLHSLCKEPFNDRSPTLYQSVVQRLTTYGDNFALLPEPDHSLVNAVYQLWQFMSVPPEAQTEEACHWFHRLYVLLVSVTCSCLGSLDNSQVSHVLDVVTTASLSSSTVYQSASCEFLKSLASKTFDNDFNQTLVCNRISSLFSQLLKINNPYMKQLALETFSYFAYVTKHEQIVPETVSNVSELQTEITNYFEAQPLANSNVSLLEHLETLRGNFVHKCRVYKKVKLNSISPVIDENPSKKLKLNLDESVTCILQRIDTDVCSIEESVNSSRLSDEQLFMLNNIFRKIENMVKKS